MLHLVAVPHLKPEAKYNNLRHILYPLNCLRTSLLVLSSPWVNHDHSMKLTFLSSAQHCSLSHTLPSTSHPEIVLQLLAILSLYWLRFIPGQLVTSGTQHCSLSPQHCTPYPALTPSPALLTLSHPPYFEVGYYYMDRKTVSKRGVHNQCTHILQVRNQDF